MAQFGTWNPSTEKAIVKAEYDTVDLWISMGYNVVVDDTNLNPVHSQKYEEIAKKYPWVKVEYHDLTNVPIETCVAHDLERKARGERYVGKDVILNMAFSFGLAHQDKPCVVFDMDGTLSDPSHRRGFVRKPDGATTDWKPDWVKFFEGCGEDLPRMDVIAKLLDAHEAGYEIIICSARPIDYREQTEAWLQLQDIPYDRLIMRNHKDYRPDTIVKQEFLDKYLDKSKIVKVFDDRPCVIEMWRSNGIPCEDVGDGVPF
jgi:hypothetical protein